MALALWGPMTWSMLARSQIALISCGNGSDRKLWQAQKVIEAPKLWKPEGFLEEVALLTVKNEDICQVIREERGVCKDWSGICVGNCRWRGGGVRGDTGGTVSVGAELCPLKKRY